MRLISIVGDSISTYGGFNPEGYAVFYDRETQQRNGLTSVYDTWWAKVNQALGGYLCVNNAYSGSRVTGRDFPAASSKQRTGALHTAQHMPDLILVYIGFNDFGSGAPVRRKGLQLFSKKDPDYFADAYCKMLAQIKANYPQATIVCATLMRSQIAANEHWVFPEQFALTYFEDYNQAIRQICRKENCFLADLSALNWRYETLDGTHPTKNGHDTLYRAWVSCLSQLGIL